MVSTAPDVLRREAEQMFRSTDVPDSLAFFADLSPLNQRLFVVELWEALSRVSISANDQDLRDLVELIEGWEATAELEQAPEVLAALKGDRRYRPLDLDRLGAVDAQ